MGKLILLSCIMLFSIAVFAQADTNTYDVIELPVKEQLVVEEVVIKTYKTAEVMPEFPGGESAKSKYLATIKYPPKARNSGLQGTSYIMFVVNEQGKVVETSVVKSSGHGILDTASLDLIKAMPKWKPGMQDGKPVRVQMVVPMKFKLSGGPSGPKRIDIQNDLLASILSEKGLNKENA